MINNFTTTNLSRTIFVLLSAIICTVCTIGSGPLTVYAALTDSSTSVYDINSDFIIDFADVELMKEELFHGGDAYCMADIVSAAKLAEEEEETWTEVTLNVDLICPDSEMLLGNAAATERFVVHDDSGVTIESAKYCYRIIVQQDDICWGTTPESYICAFPDTHDSYCYVLEEDGRFVLLRMPFEGPAAAALSFERPVTIEAVEDFKSNLPNQKLLIKDVEEGNESVTFILGDSDITLVYVMPVELDSYVHPTDCSTQFLTCIGCYEIYVSEVAPDSYQVWATTTTE